MAQVKVTFNAAAIRFPEKLITKGIEAVNEAMEGVNRDFLRSCKDFNKQPVWERKSARLYSDGTIRASQSTTDEDYVRLNNGIEGHVVAKQIGKVVRFRPDYRRKTRKGRIPSTPGGYGQRVLFRTVTRPWETSDVEPMQFDLMVKQNNQKSFERIVVSKLSEL